MIIELVALATAHSGAADSAAAIHYLRTEILRTEIESRNRDGAGEDRPNAVWHETAVGGEVGDAAPGLRP